MRRIIKRLLKQDARGNTYVENVQELIDDEHGTISETDVSTYGVCEACSRPVENHNDVRACDRCGRICCDRCAVPCAVCARGLCARCRRGFGEKQLTVCPECLTVLNERLEYQDQLLREKAAFERRIAVQREILRLLQCGMFHAYQPPGLLQDLAELVMIRKLKRLEASAEDE